MKQIVITGGPCAGKTSVIKAIQARFGGSAVVVPETATLLLGGGFPAPGKDLPWSPGWQLSFQAAVVAVQMGLEQTHREIAEAKQADFIICDRGLLDGAAYTQGGLAEFCQLYGVKHRLTLRRYDAVIHLESLATAMPEKYGRGGNQHRFESLEEAQSLERRTREAWASHKRVLFIGGKRSLASQKKEVIQFLEGLK
jgi:predicted ATPase